MAPNISAHDRSAPFCKWCVSCSFSRMTVHNAINWEAHDRALTHASLHWCEVDLSCAQMCLGWAYTVVAYLLCAQNISRISIGQYFFMTMTATKKMSDMPIVLLAMRDTTDIKITIARTLFSNVPKNGITKIWQTVSEKAQAYGFIALLKQATPWLYRFKK